MPPKSQRFLFRRNECRNFESRLQLVEVEVVVVVVVEVEVEVGVRVEVGVVVEVVVVVEVELLEQMNQQAQFEIPLVIPKATRHQYEVKQGYDYDQYNAAIGLRSSSAILFDEEFGCPSDAEFSILHGSEKTTEAMERGTLFHTMCLEPDRWRDALVMLDEEEAAELYQVAHKKAPRRKSDGQATTNIGKFETLADYEANGGSRMQVSTIKAWYAKKEAEGIKVVTPETLKRLRYMAGAIQRRKEVADELAKCPLNNRELSVFAPIGIRYGDQGPTAFIRCKARLDALSEDGETLIDLKSCRETNPIHFRRTAVKLGYDFQAAFHIIVARALEIPVKRFGWLAVESEPPYTPVIHWFRPDWMRLKIADVKALLHTAADHIERNDFPSWPCVDLAPPNWIEERIMEENP